MGKGSGRRPTEISEEEFQNNFDRIFRGPQPEVPVACPEILVTDSGSKVRCYKLGEHIAHNATLDGVDYVWIDEHTVASQVLEATSPRPASFYDARRAIVDAGGDPD